MTRIITLFFFTICTLMCNFIYAQQCKFVQVSSKSGHSFGISAEGKLYAWGSNSQAPVSYTHLRAHETVLDLVCRLLLEKKKTYK